MTKQEAEKLDNGDSSGAFCGCLIIASIPVVCCLLLYGLFQTWIFPTILYSRFENHLSDYIDTCSIGQTVAPRASADASKILVIDAKEETIVRPIELGGPVDFYTGNPKPASSPNNVRYLGCLTVQETVVGQYNNGCPAVRLDYDLTLYDLVTSTNVSRNFVGSDPPSEYSTDTNRDYNCESGKNLGIPDYRLIRQWLSETTE